MAWRDRLLNASFRGISFKIEESDYGIGRRNHMHQFANRDKPYLQDLGSDAEEFNLSGYIIQSVGNDFDYFGQRDNLIRALKAKGSGILIHPFFGMKKVGLVGQARIRENFSEGGIARFDMTFKESGERVLPVALKDFLSAIDNKINEVMDVAGDAFYIAYNAVASFQDVASTVISRSIGTIQIAITCMEGIATKIINESTDNVNLIRNSIDDIISSPNDIFNAIKNSANSFVIAVGLGDKVLEEQNRTAGFAGEGSLATGTKASDIFASQMTISTTVTGGETGKYSGVTRGEVIQFDGETIPETLGRSIIKSIIDAIEDFDVSGFGIIPSSQENNVVFIIDIFKLAMVTNLCRVAIRTNFFSQEDMITCMNNIASVINQILLDMGAVAANGSAAVGVGLGTTPIENKDLYLSIEEMRNVFVENMLEKASGITNAIDYTIPPDIETCLELAYNRYEDLNRAEEIYKRNKLMIQHPGFLPGGETIKILDE